MIKINLCPFDELENQYWYAPDVTVLVTLLFLGFFGIQYHLGFIEDQIEVKLATAQGLKNSYEALAPDLKRFNSLQTDVDKLNRKLKALQAITVSKIGRYKPVIVVEHLQNLRPEGLWYRSLTLSRDNQFEITGQAFDALLVSELMATMTATASQQLDHADLRTQVYFAEVALAETRVANDRGAQSASGTNKSSEILHPDFPELAGFPTFRLTGSVVDRTEPAKPAAVQDSTQSEKPAAPPAAEAPAKPNMSQLKLPVRRF